MVSKSKSEMFDKTNNSKNANNTKRNILAESSILSMSDLERIKKNAINLSKEDQENNKKILLDQKLTSQASAQVKKIKNNHKNSKKKLNIILKIKKIPKEKIKNKLTTHQ